MYFLLAAVDFHIIGVDFLRHFKLLVDVTTGLLSKGDSKAADIVAAAVFSTTTSHPTVEALGLGPPAAQQDLAKPPAATQGPPASPKLSSQEAALLSEFADVLNADGRLPQSTHGVEHHIVTTGRPVSAKFCRFDATKLVVAKEEFRQLEEEGIVSGQTASGPAHCTWCRRVTVIGGHVGIFASLTSSQRQTATPCPT